MATANPAVESLLRLGFIVRGLLYMVIGVLAFQVAIGMGGAFSDPQGAIVTMGKRPFGSIVLVAILIGLIGYAMWGGIRAVFDPLHKGNDLKGLAERVGYAISGVSYALLAVATYDLIAGGASAVHNGAQTAQTQQTAASILSRPWGPWAVALAAVLVVASGVVQIVQSVRPGFEQQFHAYALDTKQRKWAIRLGRIGTAARGVVFALVGLFLFLAAYKHEPNQARGIDGVLATLLHQPFGPVLVGVVALGLIAFGIYSALNGLWFRLGR